MLELKHYCKEDLATVSLHRVPRIVTACSLALALLPSARAETVVAPAPQIFEPGVISGPANDGAPTFTPDGKTLYFGRAGASWGFIVESHTTGTPSASPGSHWSAPEIAPFSGQWSDSQPALSPDGTRIVFESRRPLPAAESDAPRKTQGSSLWQSTRTSSGWSEPVPLPDAVNHTRNVWKPSLASNGDLYFMTRSGTDKTWRLYWSRWRNGAYEDAQPVSFSDGTHTDVDPRVAHDGSFLIFSSAGRADEKDTHEHLYITFRHGDDWGAIIPLRYEGDYEKNPADDGEAQLSVDEKMLFFTSSRTVPIHANRTRAEAAQDFQRMSTWDNSNNNVWSISLQPWLDQQAAAAQ